MNFLNTAPWLHSYEMRINSTTSQLRLLSLAPGKQAEEPRSAQALSSISQKARPDTAQLFSIHTLKFWGLLGFRGLGEQGLWFFSQISFPSPTIFVPPYLFILFIHEVGDHFYIMLVPRYAQSRLNLCLYIHAAVHYDFTIFFCHRYVVNRTIFFSSLYK